MKTKKEANFWLLPIKVFSFYCGAESVWVPFTPFSLTHFSICKWPFRAAAVQVWAFHTHPFSLAHLNTWRWPPWAAPSHVDASQKHSLSLAHFNTSRWPPIATDEHVFEVQRYGSMLMIHLKISRWPFSLGFYRPWPDSVIYDTPRKRAPDSIVGELQTHSGLEYPQEVESSQRQKRFSRPIEFSKKDFKKK